MTKEYKGKKITVIGLGASGLAAANLLARLKAEPSVTESVDNPALQKNARTLKKAGVEVEIGKHTKGFIKGRDMVIVSPGVPGDALPLIWAKDEGIPIIGEIEFAASLCPAPIIALTGTNGKSTVTTLAGKMLADAGMKVIVCGNIGNPFSSEISRINSRHLVVVEVSSFQLERIKDFKPRVSVILNITADHIDRHRDIRAYQKAKARIFANQDEHDWSVLNYHDLHVRRLAKETRAKVRFFKGENHLAAMAVGSIFGISDASMRETLKNFKGLEHRCEKVRVIDGVRFINDSKATNVDAACWALKRCDGKVFLIAGGRDKAGDFSRVRGLVKQKVKQLILVGEAKDKIREALADIVPADEASSIPAAVRLAKKMALRGDTVLLSPMCASFDMFANFEERGRVFKQAVKDL